MNKNYKTILGTLLLASMLHTAANATLKAEKAESSSHHSYGIYGAGPVGLYLSYKLLSQDPNAHVDIYDRTPPSRPQVVRIPYSSADSLDTNIKEKLWPDTLVRTSIFGTQTSTNINDQAPIPYKVWPFIQIKDFQEKMLSHLNMTYKDRFHFKDSHHSKVTASKIANEEKYESIFVTSGGGAFQSELRKIMNKTTLATHDKREKIDEMGIYLTYENPGVESYMRQGKLMNPKDLAEKGMTYAASNNESKSVQLYTYPVGDLKETFEAFPESLKGKASFGKNNIPLSGHHPQVNAHEKEWLNEYKEKIIAHAETTGVPLPTKEENPNDIDTDKIKVYYAKRYEYAYQDVAFPNNRHVPLMFVGDSAGSTDYKLGLSLGRGLLAADMITQALRIPNATPKDTMKRYQKYWENQVLPQEFNQNNPALTSLAPIKYNYLLKGRIIDGRLQ